jgi:hypothetical protein
MTPTDFEWGQITARVKEIDHKLRNCRQAVTLLDAEMDLLEANLARLRVEIRTTLAVLGAVCSALAYFLR